MENVANLPISAVSAVLLGYGIAGFVGNLVGGYVAGRSERLVVVLGSTAIAVLAAALLVAGQSAALTSVAIILWGFAFAAFPVGFQIWIVRAAPDQAEGASGLLVAAFQVAIASGALGGRARGQRRRPRWADVRTRGDVARRSANAALRTSRRIPHYCLSHSLTCMACVPRRKPSIWWRALHLPQGLGYGAGRAFTRRREHPKLHNIAI